MERHLNRIWWGTKWGQGLARHRMAVDNRDSLVESKITSSSSKGGNTHGTQE